MYDATNRLSQIVRPEQYGNVSYSYEFMVGLSRLRVIASKKNFLIPMVWVLLVIMVISVV